MFIYVLFNLMSFPQQIVNENLKKPAKFNWKNGPGSWEASVSELFRTLSSAGEPHDCKEDSSTYLFLLPIQVFRG